MDGLPQRRGGVVAAICFVTIVCDGYDLIVYGTVVPSLLRYEPWGLDATAVGAIASYSLIGMLLGALLVGVTTDLLGRRKLMLASVTWFSLSMGACAVAPTPELFGLFRFLGGIGLGGVIPTAIALTVEFAPPRRRNLVNALMNSGYSVGAVLAAVLGLVLVAGHGFRPLLAIGALPLVLVVPVAWRWLPESVDFLAARGRRAEAERVAAQYGIAVPEPAAATAAGRERFRILLRRPYPRLVAAFAAASFLGQVVVYGLNTWLPEIMRSAGYPLGSSLQFLVALSVGAVAGALVLSTVADRLGARIVVIAAFGVAVLALLILSTNPPTVVLYLAVALAGVGSNGAQIVLNGYIAQRFPAGVRAGALGGILSVGRVGAILGPMLGAFAITAGFGLRGDFYLFVLPAALGMAALLCTPREAAPQPSDRRRSTGRAR
ncbi:aromatic acid/H+ symport family MFS transporter [Saccharopolyspora sp. HNM0986]|uniref:MFS transporter n=1 Tax=Saccharopolyspora galaxeae TaxID=2781241 RepID=UPI00190B0D79|nr:aromatic acid/H+ symport family MFS transporter [Saccharopolyspora sp. HNM0986]MBK0866766.1 aromatic acid/H+ symport family MFS transporter [Saccharopolyspora sp. HNM0986]